MLPILQSDLFTRISIRSPLSFIGCRALFILFATALLLGGNGRAQEKDDQISNLAKQLQSSDEHVRTSTIAILGRLAMEGETGALRAWITALKDRNSKVRPAAAFILGEVGPRAKEAVPDLIDALNDPDSNLCGSAIIALGKIGPTQDAVPALIAEFNEDYASHPSDAAIVLGKIGSSAIPALIIALSNPKKRVRSSAALALSLMGSKAKDALPQLVTTLKDPDSEVRGSAAEALGEIGLEARDALPQLVTILNDPDLEVRRPSAKALGKISTALFFSNHTEMLPQLRTAYDVMKNHFDPEVKKEAFAVRQTVEFFESRWWLKAKNFTFKIITEHPVISFIVAGYLLLQLIWLLLFWFRPLSLLKVIISLSRTGEKIKIPKADNSISLKRAVVLLPVHYHPRLLDAWVHKYLSASRNSFTQKPTVAQRKVYVPMPALIDEELQESVSAEVLQSIFSKKKASLLIVGEGGAGKTSLACQLAMWAMIDGSGKQLCESHQMLPVMIEGNLDTRTDGKNFLNAVRRCLNEFIDDPEPIFDELIIHLLRKRRVLVIVDSLSELNEDTRKSVRQARTDLPVAALVVTSRIEEDLGDAETTVLRPLRLQSNRLSEFMDSYFKQLGKRSLFDDPEYFAACGRLSEIVGDREITVLIAKMYAEQMIAAKETDAGAQAAAHELPRNLPDLMLGYVKRLNDQVKADKQDIHKVVNVAKVVAWECLKQTYRPTIAKRDDVLKSLNSEPDAGILLKYLEDRLQLIQTTGPISGLIRFSLDPLAEYLAALYQIAWCGRIEDLWQEFFENAEKQQGAPETIKGFLLAVRDCSVEKGNEYDVPEAVNNELDRRAGFDPEVISTVQLKKRINRWIDNLKMPDADDRIIAVETLSTFGRQARGAIPALISALKDQNSDVRASAAAALGHIGSEATDAVPALLAALGDQNANVRSSAATALGSFNSEAKDAIPTLIAALGDQDESVRSSVVSALGAIGPEAKDAVPALIRSLEASSRWAIHTTAQALGKIGPCALIELVAALGDEKESVRSSAAEVLKKFGPGAKDAVPALISSLEDHSHSVRSSVASALGAIGPEAKDAVPALINVLRDQEIGVRISAAEALGGIGPEAKDAVSALIAALKDDSSSIRAFAAFSLGKIGPEAKDAVPALIAALGDQNRDVRNSAINALGGIGPEAKDAIPILIADIKNESQLYQHSIVTALRKINPELEELKSYPESSPGFAIQLVNNG